MSHVGFLQALQLRAEQHIDAVNRRDFDLALSVYTPDIRFALPLAGSKLGTGAILSGMGHREFRAALSTWVDELGPFRFENAFGFFSSRSVLIGDVHGGRIMFTAEINEHHLGYGIFGIRTAALVAA